MCFHKLIILAAVLDLYVCLYRDIKNCYFFLFHYNLNFYNGGLHSWILQGIEELYLALLFKFIRC